MENKSWYASKTIWASIVGALCAVLALLGHNIDPGTQAVLVDNITVIASAASILFPILAAIFRAKSNTTIGRKDE